MGNYVRFTENNDNEGESWNFYIPVEGNEQALEVLREHVETCEYEEYELSAEEIPETEVDVLVKHSDYGYLQYENKLAGRLNLDKFKDLDDLYKGGIEDFVGN